MKRQIDQETKNRKFSSFNWSKGIEHHLNKFSWKFLISRTSIGHQSKQAVTVGLKSKHFWSVEDMV